MNQEVKRHAEVLLKYSLNVQPGETLVIQGEIATMPLILECYRVAIELGALPQVQIGNGELREILLKYGNDKQLQYIPKSTQAMMENVDCLLTLWGESNTRNLANVRAERTKVAVQGNAAMSKIMFDRMGTGALRWCGTLHPTQANAQEANMSLSDYEDFVYGACCLQDDNAIAHWLEVQRRQDQVCSYLNTKKKLHIISEDTDITMSVEGRNWVNCSGKVNFPDGEVFTGPVEDTAEGTIRFSFPGIFNGQEIEDIRLTFEKGNVVKASASKGEDLLLQLLDTDAGSRQIGEIAIGTNYNIQTFTRNMLFDEKIGGTVHMAIGRSIPESGGKNISSIHWDMLCNMRNGGKVYADNELIYHDGKLLI